jgi:acyl-CoA reductase-like NAD-dependent aldehyde dehydrogenase
MNADILASLTTADFAIRSMRTLFAPRKVSFQSMVVMMSYMGRRSYFQNRPLGVVGIITPWNHPLGIPFSQTVMALAAGNALIFKPSPESPLTAIGLPEHDLDYGPKTSSICYLGGGGCAKERGAYF